MMVKKASRGRLLATYLGRLMEITKPKLEKPPLSAVIVLHPLHAAIRLDPVRKWGKASGGVDLHGLRLSVSTRVPIARWWRLYRGGRARSSGHLFNLSAHHLHFTAQLLVLVSC